MQETFVMKRIHKPRIKKLAALVIRARGLGQDVRTPPAKTVQKLRRKNIPLSTKCVQPSQTMMPESNFPNDIGLPLPKSASAP